MIPAAFDYHAPSTIAEELALLGQYRDDAKILSGGQSLLPLLKLRLGATGHVIDVGRIPGLEYIREDGGYLAIGARTREAALDRSELVRRKYPILTDATEVIADPLVRNLATVGGNLAHGDPANDHPAVMMALRAEVVATGPRGARTIPIDAFFTGLFSTALEPDEILTEIRIPEPPPRTGGAYVKLERKVGDFATAASAVQVTVGSGGEVVRAGIALTNAGPTPIRAVEAERMLVGKQPAEDVIKAVSQAAGRAAAPSADRRGTVDYKREMARVLTARALRRAIQRTKEQ
jgi:aerobic carbon-monoxide dehydrogenase medium subunit